MAEQGETRTAPPRSFAAMLLRMPAAPSTFRAFLDLLDRAGELLRVPGPVSPILDVAALADQHARLPAAAASEWARAFDPGHAGRGGSALLVENVEGCDFPLAINVFGSYRRAEMALGCADGGFGQIADRIGMLAQPKPPTSLREGIAMARDVLPLLRTPPKRKKSGRCQEVVKLASDGTVDLTRLPLIKCWPLDGDPAAVGYDITAEAAGTARGEGRYITFAGMRTIHADDRNAAKPSSHNIGMYRAQLIDETHLAMHWHMHHDGAAHWRSWKKIGERMPIAICLGGEPVMPYAATSPLPPGLSELLLAGFLNGGGIPLVRARTVPLWVPANSEIVIEGWVSTECGPIGWEPGCGEPLGPGAVFEGPFGDHTGYYSLPDRYPIVEVTAIPYAAARFAEAYEEYFQRTLVSSTSAVVYDAMLLLLEALRPGRIRPAEVLSSFSLLTDVEGATGIFSVVGGRVVRKTSVVRIANRIPVPIEVR